MGTKCYRVGELTDSVQFQEIEKKHFHSDLNGINIQINKYNYKVFSQLSSEFSLMRGESFKNVFCNITGNRVFSTVKLRRVLISRE